MTNHETARKPATLDDVRGLGAIPVHHPTKPDAADVLGISRGLAFDLARTGRLPTIRLGSRVLVPVPALLRMLGEEPGPTAHQATQGSDLREHNISHNQPWAPLTAATS